jgi:hypothetical protein
MQNQEIFELSGFVVPTELTQSEETVTDGLDHLKSKIEEHKEKADAAAAQADLLRKRAADAIVAGQGDDDLKQQIAAEVHVNTEALRMAEQLEAMLPAAEQAIQKAEAAIDEHIRQTLEDCRAQRTGQLGRAVAERARAMGTSRDGKPRSTPPEKSATATLCWCERCGQPVARIVDPEAICQPVTGKDFVSASPRWPYPPFLERAELPYFKCPTCNRMPWMENDRLLVTDGFRMVPEGEKAVKQNR